MTIWALLDLRAGIGKVVKISKISFKKFSGKVRNIFGATVLAKKIFKFEKLKRFFTDDSWKAVGKLG